MIRMIGCEAHSIMKPADCHRCALRYIRELEAENAKLKERIALRCIRELEAKNAKLKERIAKAVSIAQKIRRFSQRWRVRRNESL